MRQTNATRQDYLAGNLRLLRRAAGLTQQKLAAMAGPPRATLASMEHGGANPGLDSVLAVTAALNVSLDELVLAPPEQRYVVVDGSGINETLADEGRYRARLMTPITTKGVQIQHVVLRPRCDSAGRPHPRGSQEFFAVHAGVATLSIADEEVQLGAGQLVKFSGHYSHRYANRSQRTPVQAFSVVVMAMK